jgi:hypothetical protein
MLLFIRVVMVTLANIGNFVTISTDCTNIHMIVIATTVTLLTKVIDTAYWLW